MATRSSIFAWRIPWSEESGRLPSIGSQSQTQLKRLSLRAGRVQFSSVTQLCLTLCDPWTAAHQASLSITNSWSLPKPMSIVSMMPSNYLTLCHPLLLPPSIFPAPGSFQMSQFFTSGGQSIGVSASASVLPMNIQD